MKSIHINNDSPSERQLDEITDNINKGEIAIIPTDTLYAIVCDPHNRKSIERLCKLKGLNPNKNLLSIICSDISMASEYARIDDQAFQEMKEHTPGGYTYILPATRELTKTFKGRKTIGVRIPACHTAIEIIKRLGKPLLTTSIEYKDDDYAREPGLISEFYDGRVDFIVDGGEGGIVPSTIIDFSGEEPQVVRE